MDTLDAAYRPLLEAVSFAARAHRHQIRKDGETPYVAHVFRVCLIARHVFGVTDPQALLTAALHDTIEDTTTDFDDLEKHFGSEVARWVALLSKDKRSQEEAREEAYCRGLAGAPWQVKVCKLADIFDNLTDSQHLRAEQRSRTLARSRKYLEALQSGDLPEQARRAWDTVARLVTETEQRWGGQSG
jgi:guanosine-3',5'-bis(diphosphate) 3'-pyrophosphohydrolase